MLFGVLLFPIAVHILEWGVLFAIIEVRDSAARLSGSWDLEYWGCLLGGKDRGGSNIGVGRSGVWRGGGRPTYGVSGGWGSSKKRWNRNLLQGFNLFMGSQFIRLVTIGFWVLRFGEAVEAD